MFSKFVKYAIGRFIPPEEAVKILKLTKHIGDIKMEGRQIDQTMYYSELWRQQWRQPTFDIGLFEAEIQCPDKPYDVSKSVIVPGKTAIPRAHMLDLETKITLHNFMHELTSQRCILGLSLNSTPEKDKIIMEYYKNRGTFNYAVSGAIYRIAQHCNRVSTLEYCEHETGNGISVYHYLFLCRHA
jgi:hypothetical protein